MMVNILKIKIMMTKVIMMIMMMMMMMSGTCNVGAADHEWG